MRSNSLFAKTASQILAKVVFPAAFSIFFSCNGEGNKRPAEGDSTGTVASLPAAGSKRNITVGGKSFTITDSSVSRYLFMGQDTAEYFIGMHGDSVYISAIFTKPGRGVDVFETVFFNKNDIDTTASALNGITLNEGNANEFTIAAKEGRTFQFVSYQSDSTHITIPASDTRLIVTSDSEADRIARILKISR